MRPTTQYATSGSVHIAYQVVGDHSLDLVFVPGWVSHVEHHWEEPRLAYFLHRLASFSRLIVIDKRGTGLSDRTSALPDLEQRMDDVRAVMDAVGSKRAVVFGYSEGGSMCQLFAATYPERTAALITYGCWAKRLRTPDYPWAPSMDDRLNFYDFIVKNWGGVVDIHTLAPSVADDPEFCEWFATYLRRSASPGAALALAQMNTHIDTREILPAIRVPTLIIHRTDDMDANINEARYLAEHIPGAKFLELAGADHLPWVHDVNGVLDAIEKFLSQLKLTEPAAAMLVTILAINSKQKQLTRSLQQLIERFHGEVSSGSGLPTAVFDGPARAIRCACELRCLSPQLGIGLHIGECHRETGSWRGKAIAVAEQISRRAGAGQIVVSRAVKNLTAGSGIPFSDQRSKRSTQEENSHEVFVVEDANPAMVQASAQRGSGEDLTQKQRTILQFVAQGLSNKEIADLLHLSEHTVHRHLANIFNRLNVANRAAAVARGILRN